MLKALGFLGRVAASALIATVATQTIVILIPIITALVAFLVSSGAAAIFIAGGFLTLMNQVGKTHTV